MENNIEYEAIQNSALGALAIWQFSKEYYDNSNKTKGPVILLSFLVLPIVFNKETVDNLHTRYNQGGLIKALTENGTITIGLQERMQQMYEQTCDSLNIAFASGLLVYNQESTQILPMRTSNSAKYNNENVKDILVTSKKLGYWLAELSLIQICKLLKVRF